ncbi:hypothetical protein LTR65_010086 [Meristemomyces frigidus]
MAALGQFQLFKLLIDYDDNIPAMQLSTYLQSLDNHNTDPEELKIALVHCKGHIEILKADLELTCKRLRETTIELGRDRYSMERLLRDICRADWNVTGLVDMAFLRGTNHVALLSDLLERFIVAKRRMGIEKAALDAEKDAHEHVIAASTLLLLRYGRNTAGAAGRSAAAVNGSLVVTPVESAKISPSRSSSDTLASPASSDTLASQASSDTLASQSSSDTATQSGDEVGL